MTEIKQCHVKILRKMAEGYNLIQDVNNKKAYDLIEIKIAKDVKPDNHRMSIKIEALSTSEFNVYTSNESLEIVQIDVDRPRLTYEVRNKKEISTKC